MKSYQDKNEANKIFSAYEKIYLPTRTAKIKHKIKYFFYRICLGVTFIKNAIIESFKPKINIPTSCKEGFGYMPDPKNETYLNNEDINQIRLDLISKTENKYNKNLFKHDIFARFVKPKHSTTEFLS
jgi:hypothetical protein